MKSVTTALQDDSRLGRASASSMARYFACLGAWGLEQVVAAQTLPAPDVRNAAADKGTLIHEANEASDVSDLEVNDADTVEAIRESEVALTQQWASEHGFDFKAVTVIRERRFWFGLMISAKVDTLIISPDEKHALIIDAKSGRKSVAPPVRNWQLRTAAVAVGEYSVGLETIRVAIIQPFAKEQPACDYTRKDIGAAGTQLLQRVHEMQKPDQPRTPGTHCEHCPAKLICPEVKSKMSVVIRQAALNWDLVKPEAKAGLWQAATLAEQAAKLIKAQIRKDIETDAKSVPGLVKKADQAPRKIMDTNAAYNALPLLPSGQISVAEFMGCCSISLKDFLALYRAKTGATAEQAERFIADKCGEFVAAGFRSGTIELAEQ
jgi:hypothetical protein